PELLQELLGGPAPSTVTGIQNHGREARDWSAGGPTVPTSLHLGTVFFKPVATIACATRTHWHRTLQVFTNFDDVLTGSRPIPKQKLNSVVLRWVMGSSYDYAR